MRWEGEMETEEPVDTLRWVSLADIGSNNNIPVSNNVEGKDHPLRLPFDLHMCIMRHRLSYSHT